MKTFRHIIPGDYIYVVNMNVIPTSKDSGTRIEPVRVITEEEIGSVIFKSINDYNKTYYTIIEVDKSDLDKSFIEILTQKWNGHEYVSKWLLVFSCKESFYEAKRSIGLSLLDHENKKLEEYKLHKQKNEEEIRKTYWESLQN